MKNIWSLVRYITKVINLERVISSSGEKELPEDS
jgi:hypothetical protein